MTNLEIDEALKYANASNRIESMESTKEELKFIKDAILKGSTDDSFIYALVRRVMKDEGFELDNKGEGYGKNSK